MITEQHVHVRKVMAGKKMTELEALVDMLKVLNGKEMAQMWLLAAVVEMLEPSTGGA